LDHPFEAAGWRIPDCFRLEGPVLPLPLEVHRAHLGQGRERLALGTIVLEQGVVE
jgi:hypothetical protein